MSLLPLKVNLDKLWQQKLTQNKVSGRVVSARILINRHSQIVTCVKHHVSQRGRSWILHLRVMSAKAPSGFCERDRLGVKASEINMIDENFATVSRPLLPSFERSRQRLVGCRVLTVSFISGTKKRRSHTSTGNGNSSFVPATTLR
mmetsp:Transcript_26713/g.70204  ORF Transcript_26713/g.70204 Transcript_26713/m.70204 type:complete len:146 (+) Transcript_26713:2536-2973(+)